jgi:RNA polymerase sigma-70 factor (ECF subfamily)
VQRLRPDSPDREAAVAELHALLLRAARFEVQRRLGPSGGVSAAELADLAEQSADDALMAILAKLEEFRGESRFTTWAYKFALYEAAAKCRRRSWREREVQLEPERWPALVDPGQGVEDISEARATLAALAEAIDQDLTPHQRTVVVALILNEVPIDVLAERLGSSRGALYKALHDARRNLRAALVARGLPLETASGERRR